MKVYLAMSAKPGRPVGPELARCLPQLVDLCLPAEAGPWRHESWSSRDGASRLLAWSNEPDSPRLLAPILVDGARALGVPGYLARPADASRLLAAEEPGAVADQLGGVFGVFRADQDGFTAITTAARADAVYHATDGELEVAGNRALLVHLAARALADPDGPAPVVRYDLAGVCSVVRHSFIVGDETPFEGVRALPAHSTLQARHGFARIETRPLPPAQPEIPGTAARRQQVRALAEGLAAAVAPLAGTEERTVLALTGGRDSRMIAAALHAAGVRFETSTKGTPEHPDVVVAARVARALGASHTSSAVARSDDGEAVVIEDPLVRTVQSIRTVEGMISTFYNVAQPTPFRIAPRLTGAGGEQFRGGYLTNQADLSWAAIDKRVRTMFVKFDKYLTPWAREQGRHAHEPWAAHARREPLDALDKLYLRYRTGRWVGASRVATDMAGVMLYPLLDNVITRRVLGMSLRWRWSEEPLHLTISELAPALREIPLASKRWRYQGDKPPRLFGRRSWLAQTPATAEAKSAALFDWRTRPDAPLVAMIREQILDGPPALLEIVDRAAMETLLSTDPLQHTNLIWSTYTASVLLSGAWMAVPSARPKIQVRIA